MWVPAFSTLAWELMERGGLDESVPHRHEFGIERVLVGPLLGLSLLRYMGLAAQYPDHFAVEQEDYFHCLYFLQDELT